MSKLKSIIFIFASLFIGLLTYILFRPIPQWNAMFFFGRLDIESTTAIIVLSHNPISKFIMFHLADILWALALAETIYVIKRNLLLATILPVVFTILIELAQYFDVIFGTGDILDVIFVGISLGVYYLARSGNRGKRKFE